MYLSSACVALGSPYRMTYNVVRKAIRLKVLYTAGAFVWHAQCPDRAQDIMLREKPTWMHVLF